jgi:hypothetical protein
LFRAQRTTSWKKLQSPPSRLYACCRSGSVRLMADQFLLEASLQQARKQGCFSEEQEADYVVDEEKNRCLIIADIINGFFSRWHLPFVVL